MAGTDDRRPPVPDGLSGEGGGIVPAGGPQTSGQGRRRLGAAALWLVLGGAMVPAMPAMAGMAVAYGLVLSDEGSADDRGFVPLLLAITASVVSAVLVDPSAVGQGIVTCLVAAAMGRLMRSGRVGVGQVCLMVALGSLACMGADALACQLAGTSLPEVVEGQIQAVQEELLGSTDITVRATAASTGEALGLYWPSVYVLQMGLTALFCHWGCLMALRRLGRRWQRGALVNFDAPAWVALVYAAGAAASIAGLHAQGVPPMVRLVGENAFTCARVVLFAQGTGVALWFLHKRNAGPLTRALSVCLSVWLESSYVIMSVVGLVDVLVNFRGRQRGRRLGHRQPGTEGKESASADQ